MLSSVQFTFHWMLEALIEATKPEAVLFSQHVVTTWTVLFSLSLASAYMPTTFVLLRSFRRCQRGLRVSIWSQFYSFTAPDFTVLGLD